MAARKSSDQGITILKQVGLSMLIWAVTMIGAMLGLKHHDASPLLRSLYAAIAIGGFLPWVYIAAKAIFAEDEFNQRIHLLAIAVTFAITGVGSFACDFLYRARLIPELPVTGLWMLMVVVWWIAIMVTARLHR